MLKKAFSTSLAIAVLAPSAALAQSAGDEQYADPLANQQPPQQRAPSTPKSNAGSGNSGSDNSGSTNAGAGNAGSGSSGSDLADSTPSSGVAAATPPVDAAKSSQAGSSGELPRTGSETPLLLVVLGAMMVLTGTLVRWTSRALL